ncbi:MerR family transcriptional regulator [Vallitalea okinawensis]|uniref:MerR family transcriptional regulator n=1 Tax=Vallitalea okinawensis TaxID=2078660 RepID=UPI000CFB9F63|nr:MerR family transcriptional regulator [Vallitalea okinawensis]
MYTIGQVAKFLGISRDALKFYEEKGLVNPKKDSENGYRKYDHFDIYDVIATNFYRELDIEIKQIQEIKKSMSVKDIEVVLEEKEEKIQQEIAYKELLLKRIKSVREDCKKVEQHLGRYSIKEMHPLEVKGTIVDYTAYDEYDILRDHTDRLKGPITYTGLRRVIYFDEEGMKADKFLVVRSMEDLHQQTEGEVLSHPKCIYIVLENGRWLNGGKNIDSEVEASIRKIAKDNNYELEGVTYINLLITTYEEGLERVFLEIYTPIK